jgi:SNF2 family DNA or RNA helicase
MTDITLADLIVPPVEPPVHEYEQMFMEYLVRKHRFQPDYDAQQELISARLAGDGNLAAIDKKANLWRQWNSIRKYAHVAQIVCREIEAVAGDHKVVVASSVSRHLEWLLEAVRAKGASILYAGQEPRKRANIVKWFNEKKHHRVIVAHMPALNPAVRLPACDDLILLDVAWNFSENVVAMRRLWNADQQRPVRVRIVSLANCELDRTISQLAKADLRKNICE